MGYRQMIACLCASFLLAVCAGGQSSSGIRAKVGAYYFDGWSGGTDQIHLTTRLKTEFAHRQPVWGWHDDTVEIMERQIDLAADHGLSFFSFCWYWPEGPDKQTPLNQALTLFLKARNRGRMEFCLLVANHAGFRVGPKDWQEVSGTWIRLFREPGYLTIDGKPLMIFFSASELLGAFGGAAPTRAALERLRQQAETAGVKGLKVAVCCLPGPDNGWDDLAQLAAAGFDLFTGYNYPYAGVRGPGKRQSFEGLIAGHKAIWDAFARQGHLPYVPCVTTGWDMRPWERPDLPEERRSVYCPDRSPSDVARFVRMAIEWLDRNPGRTPRERLVLLYAWNENGEGGYLTPTLGDGMTYLEALARVIKAQEQ